MKCNRKKPEACFNCTLPDCIDDESEKTEEELNMVLDAVKEKRPLSMKPKCVSSRKWHEKHPEYIKEYGKVYREKNKEKLKAYRREYYLAHRADALEKQRIYDMKKRKAAVNG